MNVIVFKERSSLFTVKLAVASLRRCIRNVWQENFDWHRFLSLLKKNYVFITKGELLEQRYLADFVCYDKIVVELKAVQDIAPIHKAQVLNYLNMSRWQLGLLVNFGHYPKVTIDRIAGYQAITQKQAPDF